jgi:hypothetical protein
LEKLFLLFTSGHQPQKKKHFRCFAHCFGLLEMLGQATQATSSCGKQVALFLMRVWFSDVPARLSLKAAG